CHRERAPQTTTFDVEDAWVRATPDSGSTTAAYIRFVNGSAVPVTISQFSSDAARVVELHESSVATGEAEMRMLGSLVIAPGHAVTMKPGGYHLMLIGTTHPLVAGKLIRVVMHLSDGTIMATSARVKP
ncbi:MAG TPA: copper chaperone PCu(A)C, partial [Gemmatimonadaceae bacterium]